MAFYVPHPLDDTPIWHPEFPAEMFPDGLDNQLEATPCFGYDFDTNNLNVPDQVESIRKFTMALN